MKKLLIFFIVMMMFLSGCESMLINNQINQLDNNKEQDKNLNELKEIVEIHSDYPHFDNLNDLSERATDIVMGTIIGSRVDELFIMYDLDGCLLDDGQIFTIFTLQILNVYKGIYKVGDTIEIKQPGGETDRVIYVATEEPVLNEKEDYVFFLYSGDYTVPASYLNPYQSIYFFDVNNGDSLIKLNSVSKLNDIDLTYDHLSSLNKR